jgi:glucose-1-phosphate cytidylyltransferase
VRLGADGRVESFNEKPQTEAGYINGGFMVCEPAIFDYLPDDPAAMLEEEPLRRLASEGKLAACRHEGFWQPMDTAQEFSLLNRLWNGGRAPWVG